RASMNLGALNGEVITRAKSGAAQRRPTYSYSYSYSLDLSNEIQRRSERLLTRGPLRRAHLTRMRCDVLRGLHFAEQLLRIAADPVVVDLVDLDEAFGVDEERAAQRQPFFLDQHAE